MKIFALVAAAGLAFIAPTAASAAVVPAKAPIAASSVPMTQTHVRVSVGDQRRHGARRHGARYHHSRRASWRRTCRTTWRHGHRVRSCTRVRYWR